MELRTRNIGTRLVIELPFRSINMENISMLSERLFHIIDSTDGNVVLDLSQVESLDSRALGFIISIHKRCIMNGGRLSLLSATPCVRYLLTVTRVDNILDIFSDEMQVVQRLQNSA
jgi:anti-sigma B factor antagonist